MNTKSFVTAQSQTGVSSSSYLRRGRKRDFLQFLVCDAVANGIFFNFLFATQSQT